MFSCQDVMQRGAPGGYYCYTFKQGNALWKCFLPAMLEEAQQTDQQVRSRHSAGPTGSSNPTVTARATAWGAPC